MNPFTNAVDAMDAFVFSGDDLFDAANRALFQDALSRWQRKLAEWQAIADEIAAEKAEESK